MPIIKPSSDLQRNFGAISELAHETGEPIYITRNGESSLVVLDAEVYERTLALEREIHAYERGFWTSSWRRKPISRRAGGASLDEIRRLRAERNASEELMAA